MKMLTTILLFSCLSVSATERDWYRIYLNTQIVKPAEFEYPMYPRQEKALCGTGLTQGNIPRFQRPKGAIFCRMEDYLTAKRKVWIKVGVK